MGHWGHCIVNLTKGKIIFPFAPDELMAFSYLDNPAIQQMEHLLQTDWKGDQVAVCWNILGIEELEEHPALLDADEQAPLRLNKDGEWITPADRGYEDVTDTLPKKPPIHFILNHRRKEYVDQWKAPIDGIRIHYDYDEIRAYSISPLSLLLVSGNYGHDPYEGIRKNIVGRWCGESPFLELANTLEHIDESWNEIRPDFTEEDGEKECFPETALSDFVAKVKSLYANCEITFTEAEKLKVDPCCTHLLTTRQLRKELRKWIAEEQARE